MVSPFFLRITKIEETNRILNQFLILGGWESYGAESSVENDLVNPIGEAMKELGTQKIILVFYEIFSFRSEL